MGADTPRSASQTKVTPVAQATVVTPVPAPSEVAAKPASSASSQLLRRVHLAVDKNLPGRVLIRMDTPGKVTTMRAKITFLQNGQIVNEVRSDDKGHFQVMGLQPGVYSVAAIAQNAAAAALVEVLPNRPNVPRNETVLELTLDDPPPEGSDPPPAPMAMPMDAAPTAGGGGGGGGMGALAGSGWLGRSSRLGRDRRWGS